MQKEADPGFMKKESERILLLQKRHRALMNEEELAPVSKCNQLKTKRCRERKKATEKIKIAVVPKKCFATPLGYGKAIKKLKKHFLKLQCKRVEAVMGLVFEVGLKLKESDFNRNSTRYGELSDEVKLQVIDIYYYIVTGLKDKITVSTKKGQEKWENVI